MKKKSKRLTLQQVKDKYFPNTSLDWLERRCKHDKYKKGKCPYCEAERKGWIS